MNDSYSYEIRNESGNTASRFEESGSNTVSYFLDILEEQIALNGELLKRLENKISPVLSLETVKPVNSEGGKEISICEIADRVRGLAESVSLKNKQIDEMISGIRL